MADILIRGMAKMPGNCRECMFAGFGGMRHELNVCMFSGESQSLISHERMSKCPLVPLPEGHGELIDKQAFIADIDGFIECMTSVGAVVDGELLWGKLLDALANAKNIVPAEGGTKDGN